MNGLRRNQNGFAAVFLIVGGLILVMLALILVPKILNSNEAAAVKLDEEHEQTAEDSAKLWAQTGGAFTAVYDYYNKIFVQGEKARKVEPYGESKEHDGMVILVTADANGNTKVSWTVPKEVPYDNN